MFMCTAKSFSAVLSPFAVFFLGLTLLSGSADAQEGLEGYKPADDSREDEPKAEPIKLTDPDAARHGVGLRLRYVFVPKSLIEVFLEEAPSGMGNGGFGLDYVYRKKDYEFSVGFEYDKLSPDDGFFVESGGGTNMPGTIDEIKFQDLSWFSIDAAFVWHKPLSELVSLRYGGGFGFGVVRGEIISKDAGCFGDDTQNECAPIPGAPEEKKDFFRYPPVFNALAGVQFTPGDNLAINLEIGMRTVFYTGVGAQYFF